MTAVQPVTEVPVEPQGPPAKMTPQQRISEVIAAARATLNEDGTAALVDLGGEATPRLDETTTDFPVVEPVEPEPEPVEVAPVEPAADGEADPRSVLIERQPGQNVKITFRTQEEADLIRGLQRGSLRREELTRERDQLASQREELQQFQDILEIDRAGVITEMMPPETRKELLTQLILGEGVLDDPEFLAALDRWREDQGERRAARLEIENARFKARQNVDEQYQLRRDMRKTAGVALDVTETLARQFVPDRQLRDAFMDDMIGEMKAWATQYQAQHGRVPALTPEQVLQITARRLAVYRIPVEQAKRALDPSTATPPRARPASPQAEAIAAQAQKARETGVRFKVAAGQRQVAALIPGGGVAGTPGDQGAMTPPKGQSWKERSTWLRERLGLKH